MRFVAVTACLALVGCGGKASGESGTTETEPTSIGSDTSETAVGADTDDTGPDDTDVNIASPYDIVEMIDIGGETGFDDHYFGYFKRNRGCYAGDYDLDGRLDVVFGNLRDPSILLLNKDDGAGGFVFEYAETLSETDLFWAGAAGDYDNDGDWDIFQANGGNEQDEIDRLWRNEAIMGSDPGPGGFTEVASQMGVEGPVRGGAIYHGSSAGGNWADADNDGRLDLLVSQNSNPIDAVTRAPSELLVGQNVMWVNQGNTFTDVAVMAGLTNRAPSRHSMWIDYDNDGDLDLYESNFTAPNVLLRNTLDEGMPGFVDVTAEMSLGLADLGSPILAFASMVADFNNDGWQDILSVGHPDVGMTLDEYAALETGLLEPGHAMFINIGGTGFVEVTKYTGINDGFVVEHGVMGCQTADLDADGIQDVFIGNGGPPGGVGNTLYLSSHLESVDIEGYGEVLIPIYDNKTVLIDYAPEEIEGREYPPFPYRTHGACATDFDNDGIPELGVGNGGPGQMPIEVREPNRLFKAVFDTKPHWLKVLVEGDGMTVHRDAFHTRVAVTVSNGADGEQRTLYNTKFSVNAFSGQGGPEVLFGLGDADTVHEVVITWPNGETETHDGIDGVDQTVSFNYTP